MTEQRMLTTQSLKVGYGKKIVVSDINIEVQKGEILTLIGPNGSGKTTILKSIVRQIDLLDGTVYFDGRDMRGISNKELATKMSVVLTDRVKTEMMTCFEVAASGRYPYTDYFGRLTKTDKEKVYEALEMVHGAELADCDFNAVSDGQRQRIMLARAICQEPEIIVLDEPTSFLDIRHKIDFLNVLREMSRKKQITIIMSLHEIDLAEKLSDRVICVKGDKITGYGKPEDIFTEENIRELYDIQGGTYHVTFGSVELERIEGVPKVFVAAGGGRGTSIYRELQKRGIPFATGILFENDIDSVAASSLAAEVVMQKAFCPVEDAVYQRAEALVKGVQVVIDAGTPVGVWNQCNQRLLEYAGAQQIAVCSNVTEAAAKLQLNSDNEIAAEKKMQ